MSTPTVTPAHGPVLTTGERVEGQMYYVPDDLFVIRHWTDATSGALTSIEHPMCGRMTVASHTLREVRYV
jgi:hypothetical protein